MKEYPRRLTPSRYDIEIQLRVKNAKHIYLNMKDKRIIKLVIKYVLHGRRELGHMNRSMQDVTGSSAAMGWARRGDEVGENGG
jgi:hypothetical protein